MDQKNCTQFKKLIERVFMLNINNLILTIFLFLITNCVIASEVETREKGLHERLLYLSALVEQKVSHSEYKKALQNVNMEYSRYILSGGDKYGFLSKAVKAYRDADVKWDEFVGVRIKYSTINGKTDDIDLLKRVEKLLSSIKFTVSIDFTEAAEALNFYKSEKMQ